MGMPENKLNGKASIGVIVALLLSFVLMIFLVIDAITKREKEWETIQGEVEKVELSGNYKFQVDLQDKTVVLPLSEMVIEITEDKKGKVEFETIKYSRYRNITIRLSKHEAKRLSKEYAENTGETLNIK